MAYLLDTDVLIYHIKGIDAANQLVFRLVEHGLSISSITYMEVSEGLQTGIEMSTDEPRLTMFLEHTSVLVFGRPEAQIAAHMRRELRRQGRSVRARALDLMIAATAVSNQLTLVTNNPSDYRDIPDLQLKPASIRV